MKLQLDPNSSKPLHQQAEDLLRQMIQQEEYRKGKLLPNEVELSKELNISRNTLRIPLAIGLAAAGLGITGVWWAISLSSMLKGIVAFIWFSILQKKIL